MAIGSHMRGITGKLASWYLNLTLTSAFSQLGTISNSYLKVQCTQLGILFSQLGKC